ncbi:MAG: MBL fold metallo-hydrolase RNA specificity domain-containing protein [Burkholderiales bacterium]
MKITFLGAAREVTGSSYLVEAAGHQFLVDHGMFQGGMHAYRSNRAPLRFDPRELECVVLTHAHIDHSGLLPRLVERGFRGPIYATPATCDLLAVMLPDAAYVQEREAERNHGRKASEPLYTVAQARNTLRQLRRTEYGRTVDLFAGVCCRFRDAGHILGSSILELLVPAGGLTRKIVFSGDIGQKGRPIVRDPTLIEDADIVIVESTYGNRLHKSMAETEDELVQIFNAADEDGKGNIIIPAFAVGRTQEILYVLSDLLRRGRISNALSVYVDSPMASRATEVTLRHTNIVDSDTRSLLEWQRNARKGGLRVEFTESVEESMRLNAIRHGAVIISASGMCDAGRIKHHLKHNLPRPECTIVFTGFQAQGTLGRRLVDGARSVRLFGEEVPVRARICTVGGLSAHADRDGLLDWLQGFRQPPARAFVVHGEAATALGFADLVRERLGWRVDVPSPGQTYSLDEGLRPGAEGVGPSTPARAPAVRTTAFDP